MDELPPPAAAASEGDHVEDSRNWLRRRTAERRARLRDEVDRILRQARTPLRDVVRDHVLPRLPVRSLLRFAAVSRDWRRSISVPLFRHTQSHTHRAAVSGVFFPQILLPGAAYSPFDSTLAGAGDMVLNRCSIVRMVDDRMLNRCYRRSGRLCPPNPPDASGAGASGAGASAYSPFDPLAGGIPDPTLSFLPSHPYLAVLASSNGLLCCAGLLHSFYVCNPSTGDWTPLPEPPQPDPVYCDDGSSLAEVDGGAAVALVFEPSAANLESDYHLVRAFEICEGVFGFHVFSSETGAWRVSSDVCAAESMIRGSGVSAGGVAYWRTAMQTAVGYDPAADRCRRVPWPMGYVATAEWQIGEMGGRLCCTCVTDWAVEVYALGAGDRWRLLASYRVAVAEGDGWDNGGEVAGGSPAPVVFRSRPRPLRFQSGSSEVLLCVAGRVVGLDVHGGQMRYADVAPGQPLMDPYANYVPHISTFAPVGRKAWSQRIVTVDGSGYTIANSVAAEQPMGDK